VEQYHLIAGALSSPQLILLPGLLDGSVSWNFSGGPATKEHFLQPLKEVRYDASKGRKRLDDLYPPMFAAMMFYDNTKEDSDRLPLDSSAATRPVRRRSSSVV